MKMSAQLSAASALRKSIVPHARPQRIMAYLDAIQREDFLRRSQPVPSIMAWASVKRTVGLVGATPVVEVNLEGAERKDVLVGQRAHAELSRTRAIVPGRRGSALPRQGAATDAREHETPVAALARRVTV